MTIGGHGDCGSSINPPGSPMPLEEPEPEPPENYSPGRFNQIGTSAGFLLRMCERRNVSPYERIEFHLSHYPRARGHKKTQACCIVSLPMGEAKISLCALLRAPTDKRSRARFPLDRAFLIHSPPECSSWSGSNIEYQRRDLLAEGCDGLTAGTAVGTSH
jgi:hypothetical protein